MNKETLKGETYIQKTLKGETHDYNICGTKLDDVFCERFKVVLDKKVNT